MDTKLLKLKEDVIYYKWKYDSCHKFWKKEFYERWEQARKNYKDYVMANYPANIIEQNSTTPYIRLDDLTEHFENFEN